MTQKITVLTTDERGRFKGEALSQVEESNALAVERYRFRPGQRFLSPVTYYWADWYNGETSKWGKALSFADALGFVILNISSGSGSALDADWLEQAVRARTAGARVLGYVRTTFGKRPKSEVMQEIKNHVAWYAVDGVFLDEAVNGWAEDQKPYVPYYQDLYDSIKTEYGDIFWVVNNPGSNTVEEMVSTADVLMTYEQSASNYLNPVTPVTPDHYKKYPSSKFWHVIHDVTQENYIEVMDKASKEHADHVFLTDLSFVPSDDPQTPTVNPYAGPPSEWLMDREVIWARGGLELQKQIDSIQTGAAPAVSDNGDGTASMTF